MNIGNKGDGGMTRREKLTYSIIAMFCVGGMVFFGLPIWRFYWRAVRQYWGF